MQYEHDSHCPLPLHDPAAVDLRAFYPYTPNEVKHRRRTTSAQLKVLEAVFRVDTKPNATLRNDLAAQLAMTTRGVQVWFQNRRAKEKNRLSKKESDSPSSAPASASSTDLISTGGDVSPKDEDETDSASPPATPNEDGSFNPDGPQDVSQSQDADPRTHTPSPSLASPPSFHRLNEPAIRPSSASSWKPAPSDQSLPDNAVFPSRHSLADVLSQRRGSLPANAFFHSFTTIPTHGPRSIDAWDPLARRRSVDTSLQRLVMHPYAHHARARNGTLFGPRSPTPSQSGRQSSLSGKQPVFLQARRPLLPHRGPPSNYLDMRRASIDPRTLMCGRTDGLSPPSPRPLYAVRASLPDTSLFTSSRRYVPQIPGPLPEPNFTFGAPTTTSPIGDEPPSPDFSSYSFPSREDMTKDDDDASTFSVETLSRFGSTVSVATSESSVFYDVGEIAPNQIRRDSSGSTVLSCAVANPEGTLPPLRSPVPVTTDGYFDETATRTLLTTGVNLDSQPQVDEVPLASAASPDGGPTSRISVLPVNGSASSDNELSSAFSHRSQELVDPCPSSLDNLNSSEESHSGSSSSLILTPPQPGHQTRAVKNESFGFDNCSRTRIDVTPASHPSITGSVPARHDIDTNQQSRDGLLSDGATQIQGNFTTQYSQLIDDFDFESVLTTIDNRTLPLARGRQRTEDSFVNLGLDTSGTNFVMNGAYGTAVPGKSTFVLGRT